MFTRSAIILGLVIAELAVLSGMVLAVKGGDAGPSISPFSSPFDVPTGSEQLVEDGPMRSFDAGARPVLSIDIGWADLTIRTHDDPKIDLSVSHGTQFFSHKGPFLARLDGDTVRVVVPQTNDWVKGDMRRLTVDVPAGTHVIVNEAGDINASGLTGDVELTSVGSGDMTIENVNATSVRLTADHGDITLLNVVTPRLDLITNHGDVNATGLQASNGTVEDHDGDVSLNFASSSDTSVTANASDGKISIEGSSGSDDDDAKVHTMRIGSGLGRFAVHAGDGDIELTQS